jgi:putative peptidoglycan lipid II flippase
MSDREGGLGITRTAARVGAATLLSRVFGLARDSAFAVMFGTGFVADAFNLAFLIPNVFRRVVGEGNLNPAFVPVLTEIRERRGPAAAALFLQRSLGMLIVTLVVLVVLGCVLAEPVVRLYAHDWEARPDDLSFAVTLLRLLYPYLFFAGTAALAGAALNAMNHFAVPALSPILINVFFLLGAAAALPFRGLEARALAFSVGGVAGGLAAWVVMFPKMRALGLPISPAWAPHDPDVRRVGALMLPGLVALGTTQLNLFVDTLLALRLEEGSLSALRLGNRVMLLPLGVVGIAVSTAALPALSLRAARDDRAALADTLAHSLRLLLTLLVPAAVGLVLLAEPIVALLFQYGEFSGDRSTPMTAAALKYYSLGLPAYGLVKGLSQAFYSVQDTKTPVRVAVASMVANIVLILLLMGPLGLRGLALATSVAAFVNVALLLRGLGKVTGAFPFAALARATARTLLASAALAAGSALALAAAGRVLPGDGFVARLAGVAAAIGVGLVFLLVAYRMLRHREMEEILQALPGRAR